MRERPIAPALDGKFLLLALNRLAVTSDMSPLLGAERTWRRHL